MNLFGTGQYVVDLPVSSEVSVKGGKGAKMAGAKTEGAKTVAARRRALDPAVG